MSFECNLLFKFLGNILHGISQSRELLFAKLQEQSADKQEELSARIENVFKTATSKNFCFIYRMFPDRF